MESLTLSLHQPLELLIYTSVVLIIITGVFLIKLLIDLSALAISTKNFEDATLEELKPAIRELNATMANINQLSSNVSNQLNDMNIGVKKGAKAVLEAGAVIGSHAKDVGKILGKVLGKKLLSGFYILMTRKK